MRMHAGFAAAFCPRHLPPAGSQGVQEMYSH
jgi:hypothetical protein